MNNMDQIDENSDQWGDKDYYSKYNTARAREEAEDD
jgi:hypothetical protein